MPYGDDTIAQVLHVLSHIDVEKVEIYERSVSSVVEFTGLMGPRKRSRPNPTVEAPLRVAQAVNDAQTRKPEPRLDNNGLVSSDPAFQDHAFRSTRLADTDATSIKVCELTLSVRLKLTGLSQSQVMAGTQIVRGQKYKKLPPQHRWLESLS